MLPGARKGRFTAVIPTARLMRFLAFVTPSIVLTLGLRYRNNLIFNLLSVQLLT